MPWKEKTVEKLREEFAEAAESCTNFSSLCREFGISRKTGYKWLNRMIKTKNLSDLSKAPNVIANKTPEDIEKRIIEARIMYPG